MEWINMKNEKPNQKQKVFYYFDIVGIFSGTYERVDEDGETYDCFMCDQGFLCDDVTHWMPRNEGDILPDKPK